MLKVLPQGRSFPKVSKCTVIPLIFYSYCIKFDTNWRLQHHGAFVSKSHEVRFRAPKGLKIIADCNKLWFSVSVGVCHRGQKDKLSWRLDV